MPNQPSGLGWLPDGRMLVVSMLDRKVLRQEPSGELVEHADLSAIATGHVNDMVVAPSGVAYAGNFGFDLMAGEPFAPDAAGPHRPRRHGVGRQRAVAVPERLGDHARRLDADHQRVVRQPDERVRHRRRRLARPAPRLGGPRSGRRRPPTSPRSLGGCGVRPRRDVPRRRRRRLGGRRARRAGPAPGRGRRDPRRGRRRRRLLRLHARRRRRPHPVHVRRPRQLTSTPAPPPATPASCRRPSTSPTPARRDAHARSAADPERHALSAR